MPLFLDACALAKRYIREGRSTSRMRTITGRPKRWGGLFVSSFIEIEVVSAIAKAAREYGNPMERPSLLREVPQTVDIFLKEYRSGAFDIVDQTDDIVRSGIRELRGKPQHGIGAADAIHLATALKIIADARGVSCLRHRGPGAVRGGQGTTGSPSTTPTPSPKKAS